VTSPVGRSDPADAGLGSARPVLVTGDAGEAIPRFVLQAMAGEPMTVFGDGTQTRDFSFAADTARGIVQAAATASTVGGVCNLASGREISIGTLAARIAARLGREARIVWYRERGIDPCEALHRMPARNWS